MSMKRLIISKLVEWKQSVKRKPLILKGARQVGKTHSLLQFAKSHYSKHHYFNFEKEPSLNSIFEESLDSERILEGLSLHQQQDIDIYNDLIIFDEIQACPKALTSLKYFCEEQRHAHICTAGSLLGIYLNKSPYPVGKVDHLEMYPMSFIEFLMALGEDKYVTFLQELNYENSIPQVAHEHLWKRLLHYFVTGGLPEVVQIYCENRHQIVHAFNTVREKQRDLIEDYFADIAKHSGKLNAMHINRIWNNIPEQLAKTQNGSAKRFKFKGIISNMDRYQKLADSLDWLEAAGLILKVNIINKAALPLKAYIAENSFKLFIFDIGLLGAMSETDPQTILSYDYGSYKGYFAENFIAQAFTMSSQHKLYSWMEKKAEIEFIRDIKGKIIPIEVKSGSITQAKSLKQFFEKYKSDYSVIMSAKNFKINAQKNLYYLPLYLAERFPL